MDAEKILTPGSHQSQSFRSPVLPPMRTEFEGHVIALLHGVPLCVDSVRMYGEANPTLIGHEFIYARLFSSSGRDYMEARKNAVATMRGYAAFSAEWREILDIFQRSGE